jgi:DNA-binding CsgD family transcriptional regulator
VPRKLVTLSPKHHAAIRQKIAGASGAEIAQELGVTRRTVYLWMSDALVKTELERQLAAIHGVVSGSSRAVLEGVRRTRASRLRRPRSPSSA